MLLDEYDYETDIEVQREEASFLKSPLFSSLFFSLLSSFFSCLFSLHFNICLIVEMCIRDRFKGVPVEKKYLELSEEEKLCPSCGTPLKEIGEEMCIRDSVLRV